MSHANHDPNTLFQMLVKEAHDADANQAAADATNAGVPASNATPSEATKIASTSGVVFDLAFFDKLAASDAEAGEQLNTFVSEALEQGHDPDAIGDFVAQMEADARGANGQAANADGSGEGQGEGTGQGDGDDSFEAAQAEAEAEAIEQAIDDELENNPLAKAAGVTREVVEAWMIGEAGGEAYYHGRQAVGDIVEKIASQVIPTDDMITESLQALKDAGLDVASVESEIETLKKEASTQPVVESEISKKAREMAAAEQAVVDSLTVLKCAGFDVDTLVKQAEEKKKMSTGKKALIAGGALATLGGGAYLAKRNAGAIMGAMGKAKDAMGKAKPAAT